MVELEKFKDLDRNELSLIEVAHAALQETGEVHDFNQLLEFLQNYLSLSDEQLEKKMVRFYTDLNVDGRFISLGDNRWGLRSWYAIDEIDEEIINSIDDEDIPRHRRRKKKSSLNAFAEGDEDVIDYNDDDPEDIDDIYDQIDEEDYDADDDNDEEDDAVEDIEGPVLLEDDEDEDDNAELGVYARDLSELGDDVDIDEEEIEIDDEEDDDEEDDDEDDELSDEDQELLDQF
ncbi:DNA-directed RNA polymerase subunit delta [Aerococcaceae bacterium DSM 111020]|nr:DNA-directed RNA polymerase subunit delta [Aerococcaceae bacterium DSM 111020]